MSYQRPFFHSKQSIPFLISASLVTFSASTLAPGFANAAADSAQVACQAKQEDGPLLIDESCVDPEFGRPMIDKAEDISEPVLLHKVSGHFEGTKSTFTFYFPPKEQWEGRFFHNVYPLTDGNARDETLSFGTDSGAYTVQTGGTIGYRADAAAAKFSRKVAHDYYGLTDEHIYGYVYGGSGGSYQTIGAMENSKGVWDGAVPYVIGVPTSIPNNFFVRAFARIVLQDKADGIADAMSPGGSGKPFDGLDDTERAVLKEVTAMGVPLRGWDNPAYLLGLEDAQGLMGFRDTVKGMDPTYAEDFWTKPGYLGTEQSALGDIFRAARVNTDIPILKDKSSTTRILLEHAPVGGHVRDFEYQLVDGQGASLGLVKGSLDITARTFQVDAANRPEVMAAIKKASSLRVSNDWSMALASYHRHQVPKEPGITVWDQFLKADGTPKYPQRPVEVGPIIGGGAAGGGTYTGVFDGKMIVVGNLLDLDAFPWHADWYARRVESKLGTTFNDSFRVWFNDNADHHDGSVIVSGRSDNATIRLVSYVGILQQALRDLSKWVEEGEPAPASTAYTVNDGQVSVPENATDRRGIQPLVRLTADDATEVEVAVGGSVTLSGVVTLPEGVGDIVRIEWNALGQGEFAEEDFTPGKEGSVEVKKTFTYEKPGTYFPVLRATTQREADAETESALVQNIDRVRIIVK